MIVAEMLGKFEWEVLEQMPPDELARWVGYINITNERERKRNQ